MEYLFVFPMYNPTIWVNVSDVNATSFNQTFDVPAKMAMPMVGEVVAASTNANSSLVILGVDKLDMSVNITAFADGKDLSGKIDFYLDDPLGDPIQTVDISPAMANDTSMIFEVQAFDLATLATPPSFGPHAIFVVASDGLPRGVKTSL